MSTVSDQAVVNKYYRLMCRANSKGLEFNLSFISVKNLLRAKCCYFTGKVLTNKNRSIDRVDNTKGYVKGNVVACDKKFNENRKRNLTPREIEQLYFGVILRKRSRKRR